MVLRGSKTKPDYSYHDVNQAIQTARDYLEQTEAEVHELEHEIAEVIHEELHNLQEIQGRIDDSTRDIQDNLEIPTDLTNAIRILVDRLELLETKQHEAENLLKEYQAELKISIQQLLCGGVAGAVSRTTVAPIDRVKLLIQTARTRGSSPLGILATAGGELRNHGIRSLWKGNMTNCVRVFPYAALQFASYERYKTMVINITEARGKEFGHLERLISGACAGATAATLTYPLDVMRVRQAVFHEIKGPMDAIRNIYMDGGMFAFFKGWTPTVMSLGPFIAINFATFDTLKTTFIQGDTKNANPLLVLGLGAGAGLFAQSICYPLDTVRRVMQMPGKNYAGIFDCVSKIFATDGIQGFYRGIVPNAIKIMPNNAIRFGIYSYLVSYLGIPQAKVRPKRRN